jgi:pimeloyl-ACP methyl ester carboxylesterase
VAFPYRDRDAQECRRQPAHALRPEDRRALPRDATEKDLELWPLWDAIRCPTLVLRGAESDLLTRETTEKMAGRGPKAKVVEIPGVGHAPTLMHEDQIKLVRDFLLSQ